jgi:N utilization substance protein A
MEQVGGERIDIIRYQEDIKDYIAVALTPAKVVGVTDVIDEPKPSDETPDYVERNAIAIVEEEEFLSALGKGGKNVKLAVRLTGVSIDIKTVEQAKEEGIEYTKTTSNFQPRKETFNDFLDEEFTMEMDALDDLAIMDSSEDIDYEEYSKEANRIKEEDLIKEEEFKTNQDSEEINIMEDEIEEDILENEGEDLYDDSYDEFDDE